MTNEEKQNIEERIGNVLSNSLFGMSITEIAEKTNINRMTAAKYLDVMHAKDLINYKKVGTSKLWILRERSLDKRMELIIEYFQMYNSAVNEIFGDKKFENSRQIGIKIGENIFEQHLAKIGLKSQKFSDLVQFCASAMNSIYPIPSQIESNIYDDNTAEVKVSPCLCQGAEENKTICEMQSGIIIGISQHIFENVRVEEKSCMCDGEDHCSYLIKHLT